jgi:hypothetical protein
MMDTDGRVLVVVNAGSEKRRVMWEGGVRVARGAVRRPAGILRVARQQTDEP